MDLVNRLHASPQDATSMAAEIAAEEGCNLTRSAFDTILADWSADEREQAWMEYLSACGRDT